MTRKPTRSTGPGRPKDLEKRAAILDAAKRLFPERGYDAVSMDAIAAEAGVSKLTVYSHFRDKETLFGEAVKCVCESQLPHEIFEMRPGTGPIREALIKIATGFVRLCTCDDAVQLFRTLVSRAANAPQLAQVFFEAGPRRTHAEFEAFLRQANATGALDVPDPARAALHFFAMLKGEMHTRRVMGCCEPITDAEVGAHVASVVDLFLRAFEPR